MTTETVRPVPRGSDATPGTGSVNQEACGLFQRTVELAGRRWSGAILFAAVAGARRFVEYRRAVHGISDRLLTQRLRELEQQGLITREVVPTMPVQILYTATPAGAGLIAALQPLGEWGNSHRDILEGLDRE